MVVWSGERWADDIFAWLHNKGVNTMARQFRDINTGDAAGPLTAANASPAAPAKLNHTLQLLPPDITQAEMG